MKLTLKQNQIHKHAIHISQSFRRFESALVQVLMQVEETKLDRTLECSSLFIYAMKYLELERALAYSITTLAKKCIEVPTLGESVLSKKLKVSKASRIVSTVNLENAAELVKFAEEHTTEEINLEVSRLRKKAGLKDKLNVLHVSDETLIKLKRVRSLVEGDLDATLGMVLAGYIDRHDPVKKAERAMRRKAAKPQGDAEGVEQAVAGVEQAVAGVEPSQVTQSADPFCRNRKPPRRQPLTAEEKHAAYFKGQGRCTHIDSAGERCKNERYLEIHHIQPVSEGGTNEPDNLTLLCGFHHDMEHQLSFPMEDSLPKEDHATWPQ